MMLQTLGEIAMQVGEMLGIGIVSCVVLVIIHLIIHTVATRVSDDEIEAVDVYILVVMFACAIILIYGVGLMTMLVFDILTNL